MSKWLFCFLCLTQDCCVGCKKKKCAVPVRLWRARNRFRSRAKTRVERVCCTKFILGGTPNGNVHEVISITGAVGVFRVLQDLKGVKRTHRRSQCWGRI